MCKCEKGHETVGYYLLKGPLYKEKRNRITKEVGVEGMRLSKLLDNPQLRRYTIQFMRTPGDSISKGINFRQHFAANLNDIQ